jgi:hypothetical protein
MQYTRENSRTAIDSHGGESVNIRGMRGRVPRESAVRPPTSESS